MSGAFLGHFLLIAGSFGFGIASALIPIINAEAYVLAVCATTKPGPATFAMVALVLGTLAGKLVLFLGARYREKLGRFLRLRHRDAVNTAEAGIARGIAAEIAAGEAALAQSGQTVMTDQASPSQALPLPAARPRRRWLPPPPAWLVRTKQAIVAWGDRALHLLDKPWQSAGVLMASATLGVPPLAVTTIAAGLRKTSLPVFIACVVIGRGARFAVIAVPTLLARN